MIKIDLLKIRHANTFYLKNLLIMILVWMLTITMLQAADFDASFVNIRSSDWHKRRDVYNEIVRSQPSRGAEVLSTDEIRGWHGVLIELLSVEGRYLSSRGTQFGEDYGIYISGLVSTVASFHDPRALDVLLNKNIVTTGAIATDGLAKIGDPAVESVLSALSRAKDLGLRHSLVIVLQTMAREGTVMDPAHKHQIESALVAIAMRDDLAIRIAAVRGLAFLDSASARATLVQLARGQGIIAKEAQTSLETAR